MELFVELKFADAPDRFRDQEDPSRPQEKDFCFETDWVDARLVRGQRVSYAAAHAGCQFRVHIVCVLVSESSRGSFVGDGAAVTRRFNYIKTPHTLADFFWSYAFDRRQQGYDSSASPATPADIRQIPALRTAFATRQPYLS